MIYKTIFKFLVACSAFVQPLAWANAHSNCAYATSGVDVQNFKKSKNISGFQELERSTTYTGILNGIGSFHLQLYRCAHYGAAVTVLLGSDPKVKHVEQVLKILPSLLFAPADVAKVTEALKGVQLKTLSDSQHLGSLIEELGLTDFRLQLIDIEGVSLLVLSFYGG